MSLAARLQAQHWAMEPDHLAPFLASVAGLDLVPMPDPTAPAAPEREPLGAVAEIAIRGPMLDRVPAIFRAFGIEAADMQEIREQIAEATAAPGVRAIVLRIDSPGGMVMGTDDLAQAVRDARAAGKTVTAHVEGMMASAALWVGSQADHVTAGPMAFVGSIGVYGVVIDSSRAAENAGIKVHVIASGGVKGGNVRGAPVSDAVLADEQRMIASINDKFLAAVAAGRKKPAEEMRALNTGQVWLGEEAQRLGLVDQITYQPQDTTPAQRKERLAMQDLLNLAAEHPAQAGLIRDLAKAGKTADQISAAIADAQRAEQFVALKAEAEKNKAEADRLGAELAAEKAARAKAEEDLAKLKAFAVTGKDPGEDSARTAKPITRAALAAMNPQQAREHFSKGGIVIDDQPAA